MSIGYHVDKSSGKGPFHQTIINAYKELSESGFNPCMQIFATGPRGYKEILTPEDKEVLKKWPNSNKIVIHGAYVDIPWNGKPVAIHNIKNEMIIAGEIGATGVVVHLSEKANDKEIMTAVLGGIANMPKLDNVTLWLENKPAKSKQTHARPADIGALFNMIKEIAVRPKIGFCIDTQHAFASGVDIQDYTTARKWIESIRAALPAEFEMMIHLNDSASGMGSGIDCHANLGKGQIWKGYGNDVGDTDPSSSGFVAILLWAEENNVRVILETPQPMSDLSLLGDLGLFKN